MNAILVSEDLDFVLTEECPPKPTKDTDQTVWEAYKKWVKADKRACWCILAGMSEVLVARHEQMATSSLMMKSLHDIFEQPSEWQYHEVSVSMMTTKMRDELTLSESMLMDSHNPSGEANVAESSKSVKKRENFIGKAMAIPMKNKNSSKDTQPKGKCFYCNKDGHWKRNCPKYLAELREKKATGKYDLLVIESLLVEDDKSAWIIDSGATNHVYSSSFLQIWKIQQHLPLH